MPVKVLTIPAACEYLRQLGFTSVGIWTVREMIHNGDLKAMRLGKRDYVAADDIDAFVARNMRRSKTG